MPGHKRWSRRARGSRVPVFSRSQTDQTDTPAFKEWYGNWQNPANGNTTTDKGIQGLAGQPAGYGRSVDAGRAENVNAVQRPGDMDANNPGPVTVGTVIFTGASGPVGEAGRPTRFYHGTRDSFTAFDTNHKNRLDKGWLGRGVYATNSSSLADSHAESVKRPGNAESNTMPLYMAVRNPYVTTNALKSKLKNASQETIDKFTQALIKQGYVLAGQ